MKDQKDYNNYLSSNIDKSYNKIPVSKIEDSKEIKNFSSEYNKKNKESIANISIESKEKINFNSALSYILSNIPNNNYKKEIEY